MLSLFEALVVLAAGSNAFAPDTGNVPRFEQGPCGPAVAANERIDCGLLVVWENRARPGGTIVRIPVRIFHSRSATPAADPVLFMVGGPGAAVRTRSGRGERILDERDLIVFDQRGTRNAQPAVECPEVTQVKQTIRRRVLAAKDADQAWIESAARCAERYRAAGIDIASYTTRAIAEDVEDLRQVLGVRAWNLYGLSYSTRVMLTVMRDHPATVRSVVLDSPLPLESRFDEMAASNLRRSLNLVLDACAVTPACASRHADTRAHLDSAIARFDRTPRWLRVRLDSSRVDSLRVTGASFAEAISDMVNDPSSISAIPDAIDRAATGDIAPLERWFAQDIQPSSYAMGQRILVWCSDIVPFEDRGRIAAQRAPSAGFGGDDFAVLPPAVCDALHLPSPPPGEGLPVHSDIPTFILVGEFDPNTPMPWARGLLSSLTRASLVVMPGASHGPGGTPCGATLVAQFVADPQRLPNDLCLAQAHGATMDR